MEFRLAAALALAFLAAAPAPASAQLPAQGPPPEAYRAGDAGGFLNVLPPGENGFDNALDLAQFDANHTRPPNSSDHLPLYPDLLAGYRTLDAQSPGTSSKDAGFGVKPGDATRAYSPRSDVTIARDKYDVPHI